MSNSRVIPAPPPIVWAALNDPDALKASIPGCESLEKIDESSWKATVVSKIGPVSARFTGNMKIVESDPPNGYTLRFEGQGGPAGHGKGTADIRLEAVSPRETMLHYTAHATVGGKIAQVGSRLVDMAAQKMAGDFFERFNEALKARYGVLAEAAPAAAPAGLLARLVAWLKGLFGGGASR